MRTAVSQMWVSTVVIAAVLCTFATPTWAQNPSLAVIAADKTLDPLADLLTVELSKQAGVTLLERGEINRILGEQQFAGTGESNSAAMGQLLRADGVIVLRRARGQQQELLVADLVSVGLAFRVDSLGACFPVNNPNSWASDLKTRFLPLIPKLGVQPRDAIPISLLNLRAAVLNTDAKVLERSLSYLLADRLMRQPQVFLLERQHLGALELEKDFMTGAELPEWTSARFVADGEIIQGGPDTNKITLRLTIEPPQDKSPTVFTVTGSRQQLAQLVEETVAKILAATGQPSLKSEWQSQEEAKRFFREALSADRAGLDEEALAAGEASEVLGCHSDQLTDLLVRQSCRKAFSGRGGLSDGYDRSQVDEATLDIGLVQRALELANSQTNSPGLDVLLTAARVLRYYRETDGYNAHRQELETLRTTLRATVDQRAKQRPVPNTYEFWAFLAGYASYLYDDPLEVIESYRCVLHQRVSGGPNYTIYPTARLRHYLAEARDTPRLFGIQSQRTPWLVAWRSESPETLNQIWETFLDELSASTNVNDRLDGLLLRLYSVENEVARKAVENQIRDALWNARDSVVADKFTYAIAVQLLYAIKKSSEAFHFQLLDYFLKAANFYDYQIFEQTFTWFNGAGSGFKKPEYRAALLKSMDEYGSRMTGRGDFQAAEFAKYRQRLTDGAAGENDNATIPILHLKKAWQPVFPKEPGFGEPGFAIRKVIYRDSSIWVLGRGTTVSPPTNTVWLKVFQVDPQTFAETALDVPLTDSANQASSIDMDYDFDVSPHYIFVTTHGKLMRYDRAGHTWTTTEVPPSDFPALTVLGDALYYAFPGHMGIWGMAQPVSGIIRINPQTLEQQVLASNRRKQSPTVLDDVPAYNVPSLFYGPEGTLHAIISLDPRLRGEKLKVFRHSDTANDWTRVFADEFKEVRSRFGLLAFSDTGGVFFQRLEVSSRGAKFSAARLDADGRLETLIAPAGITNSLQRAPWLSPDTPWDYSNPPSTPLIATRNGNDYWVLLKYQAVLGDSLALYHYVPGTEKPTVIPLKFAGSEANVSSRIPCLFATPAGLLIGGAGGAAFWIVPWSELEKITVAGNQINGSK